LTIILRKELWTELILAPPMRARSYSLCDEVIEIGEILIAQITQMVCNPLWIFDFGPNKPESVNKRKPERFLPGFTEVPETKFLPMVSPEQKGLISDEQLPSPIAYSCCETCFGSLPNQRDIQPEFCNQTA